MIRIFIIMFFLLISSLASAVEINVTNHGAVGDGVANDLTAFQDAVDAAGFGDVVRIPRPAKSYKIVGSVKLGGTNGSGQKVIQGDDNWHGGVGKTPTIRGDGINPVFVTGSHPNGDTSKNRACVIRDLWIENDVAPCVELHTAINFELSGCRLGVNGGTTAVVSIRNSWRGTIRDCWISSGGGPGWCIDARSNVNGLRIRGCELTGGKTGGLVYVSSSVNVTIDGNICEVGKRGFEIATDPNDGYLTSINITGNYLEAIERPIRLGFVRGGVVSGNYSGNSEIGLASLGFADLTPIEIGVTSGVVIEGNSIKQPENTVQPVVMFVGWNSLSARRCKIENNWCLPSSGLFSAIDAAVAVAVGTNNTIQPSR